MTVKYSPRSLYYRTPQTDFALSYLVFRDIPPDNTDTYVVLSSRHTNRPTVLSYDLYSTPAYWWVFNVLNMDVIQDPIRDFVAGTVIRVPTLQRLQTIIGS
jgi:hypothetical protein